MSPVVACKALKKSYRSEVVLERISFELSAKQALVVTGPNGAGKTSLLSILAGLVQQDEGEIRLKDEVFDVLKHRLRRRIGFAPANETSLFVNATVIENLRFWAKLQGLHRFGDLEIERLAVEWGVEKYLKRPVREISSGFRRRVALARAFLHDPTLVLLDEPFAFLDNDNQERVRLAMESWLSRSSGALIVSSNVDFARGSHWKSLALRSHSNG
jgi:ABC-type multidrug transport system ATPase subunit